MRPPLEAIFFDAVGTIIYLPLPVGEHYRTVASRFGLDLSADALDQAFRACWKSMPGRPAGSGPRADDDKGWWRELVARVLTKTLSPEEHRQFDEESYFEAVYAHFALPGVWAAYEESVTVLGDLRSRGLKLGIISNFDQRLYLVLGHVGLRDFFDCVVVSSEAGADKPDPAIFGKALSALNVTAEQAVHVGDDPKRDWGAQVAGLDVFELERPGRSLRDLLPWLDERAVR